MNLIEDFENNWIYNSEIKNNSLIYKFSESTLDKISNEYLSWTWDSLRNNCMAAVKRMASQLGDNIYVALSGGIDSQTACLALTQAGVKYTAVILIFKDGWNQPDVTSAVTFCQKHRINYVTVDIDIFNFLTRELVSYVDKYQCPSPQITAHFWFYEQVIERFNPTAIICGGTHPFLNSDGTWVYGVTRAQLAWTNFKQINNFNLVGDFLSWSFDISLLIMMNQKKLQVRTAEEDIHQQLRNRYRDLVASRWAAGFPVDPQENKLTGFEEIKHYLNESAKTLTVFDNRFRFPLERKYPNYRGKLLLDPKIAETLSSAQLV